MNNVLNEFLSSVLNEYTEKQKKEMGIPVGAVARGKFWYDSDGEDATYLGTVVNKKFQKAKPGETPDVKKEKRGVGVKPRSSKPATTSTAKTSTSTTDVSSKTTWSSEQIFGSLIGTQPVTMTRGKASFQVRPILDAKGNSIDTSTDTGKKQALTVINERLSKLDKPVKHACERLTQRGTETQLQSIKKWLGNVGELYALKEMLEAGAETYMLPDSNPTNDLLVLTKDKERGLRITEISVKSSTGEKFGALGSNARAPLHAAVADKTITIDGSPHQATDAIDASIFVYSQLIRFATEGHIVGKGREIVVKDNKMKNFDKEQLKKAIALSKQGKKSAQELLLQSRKLTSADIEEFKKSSLYTLQKTPEQRKLIDHYLNQVSAKIKKDKDYRLGNIRSLFTSQLSGILTDTKSNLVFESDLVAVKFDAEKGYDGIRITPAEVMKSRAEQKFGDISSMPAEKQLKNLAKFRLGTRGLNTHHPKTKEARFGYAGAIINIAPPSEILKPEDKLTPKDFVSYIQRPTTPTSKIKK